MHKRVTAALAAAVMVITNVMSPVTAFAGEESVQAADTNSELTETEAAFFNVCIPYFSEMDVNYDSKKYQETKPDGSVLLKVKTNENIDLHLTIYEHYELDQVRAVGASGKDADLYWKDENTITFTMPEEDIKVQASFHEIILEAEETPAVTEESAQEETVAEVNDQNNPGEVPDAVQNETDPDAAGEGDGEINGQENTGGAAALPEAVPEEGPAPEEMSAADQADDATVSGMPAFDDGNLVVSEDLPVNDEGADTTGFQNSGTSEQADEPNEAVSEDAAVPDTSFTIDESLEADGYPMQGSVIRVREREIPLDMTFLEPETGFEDVSYPQETCMTTRMADETLYGIPGTYETLYRVDESSTGKFWYVIRPVRVMEKAVEEEGTAQTPASDDNDSDEDDGTEEEDEDLLPEADIHTQEVFEDETEQASDGERTEDLEETGTETDMAAKMQETVTSEEIETEHEEESVTEGEADEVMPEPEEAEYFPAEETSEMTADMSAVHNVFFNTGEGYHITMENDCLTYQEGDEVTFSVVADEEHVIKTADAYVVLTEDYAKENTEDAEADLLSEETPILITEDKIAVTRTYAVSNGSEVVEATYEFEMPDESVVLSADVVLAAAAFNDVTVQLSNGSVRNIPKSWTPDGVEWARGSAMFGYSLYRTVTMPDGKERKAYCLQPSLMGDQDGKYTATEVRKKGKLSEAEATTLRKALFYCYGGPGWSTGIIKNVLSDCSENDEYYVATHYILGKIYCDATSGDWNIAAAYGEKRVAMNGRGMAQIEAAVKKIKSLPDPDASLSPTQVAGVYNETTGFAYTQAVTYASTVPENNLSIKLPASVYLDITGGATYGPGEKAVIPPGSTFTLRKNGYEAAHEETLICKADIFTDFDAYMINVDADHQNLGFSYVEDKDFELSVTWPDLLTHLNIVKVDAHTGTSSPTPGYSMDGAVYGIYADAGTSQLLEQLTITGGSAVSSENYVIGRTYYIAEISAPAEYQIDTNVYPIMAVAGGTAMVTSSDVPKTIKISMQKVDAETGETKPLTSALSFEGALFGVYSDEACTVKAVDINGNAVTDIRTDASGHGETPQTLLIGDYYVKELAAPTGYLINETVFTVGTEQVKNEIVSQDANAELTCEEQIIRANMDLMKVKTLKGLNTEAAEGVEFYFTYVNDPDITFTVIPGRENTVITDAEGYATTQSENYPNGTLIYGEWQITEGNTPEGFEPIDPTTFTISGNGRTYRFVANNRQIHAAVLIEKHDANTGSLIPVEGVKFRLYKDGELVSLFNSTTRVYEDTWITDADGMVQLPEMLDFGTYTIVEDPESIPDGYFVMDDAPLVVGEMADEYLHPITMTAMEPPQMGNIMVEKRDAKTDESLEGFTFEIIAAEDIIDPAGVIRTGTDADGNEVSLTAGTVVDRLITGKNGNAVSKDLYLGSYTVRETETANGYAITKETQTVTIKGDAEKARDKENVSEYALFENEPTSVKILKVSSKSGEPLEGITFLVHKLTEGENVSDYAYKGEEESPDGEINAVISDGMEENGKAESDDSGNADEGNTEEDPAISDQGGSGADPDAKKDTDVPDSEEEGNSANDQASDDAGEGSSYEEVGQSSGLDEENLSEDELYVTDENGEVLVEYLDADSTYVIREIKTIPGYNLSHELVSFSVDSEGMIDGSYIKEVTMKNDPNRVRISKVDITNSEEIKGAQLTITDSDGTVVAEWTSTYEAHEIDALPAGAYTLTEVTAPEWYEETESVTFKVLNSRKIQTAVMEDAPYREVEVSKTDITGDKELAGAHLTITDKEGNEIESWVSTADVHTVKLHSGEYILTETKPADGYVTAESVTFTVIRTSAEDYDIQGVMMKDDVTKVEITKSDITNGQPVIGAELVISDTEGNELYRWTTTQDPYYIEMLPIGTYTLTETTAPSGYATAETVSFTVKDTGEIQKVDMKDIPISVEISKKDIADGAGGNELPGAHLTVKNEAGEVIDDWVSTSEPHKISMLPVGKYSLIEVTAPNGYELAETISFEITDSGEVQKVTMYDAPKEETVDLTGKKKKTTTKASYTPSSGGGGTSVVAPVKTGDDSPVLRYIFMALAAMMLGGAVVIIRRKLRIQS